MRHSFGTFFWVPVLAAGLLTSCATGLCERRDNFMRTTCAGTDVTYQGDPMCESKIENCTEAQLAQFRGYIECLESQNICSMDTLGSCAEAWPGGVNLMCSGTP